jgi:hypothetical protein
MKTLISFVLAHQTASALIVYAMFSNIVSALPSPQSQTSFYRFVFNFLHLSASSIGRISPALRIPGPNQPDSPAPQSLDKPVGGS